MQKKDVANITRLSISSTFISNNKLHGLINNVDTNTRKSIIEQTSGEHDNMMKTNVDSDQVQCVV